MPLSPAAADILSPTCRTDTLGYGCLVPDREQCSVLTIFLEGKRSSSALRELEWIIYKQGGKISEMHGLNTFILARCTNLLVETATKHIHTAVAGLSKIIYQFACESTLQERAFA